MVQCAKILENWNKMSAQIQALLDDNVDREEDSPIIEDIFKAGRMWLMKYLKHTILHLEINMRVLEPFCDLLLDYQSYVDHTIPTLYRTAWDKLMTREDEIVGLLHHVTQQSTLVAEQICVVVEEWNSQYETKELRSRQRKTYFRLLQRLLKFMLKYSELLTTYMSSNRNRWKEATDLTVQLSERVCTTVKQENNNECTTSKTVTDSI
ncbi:hypothetical protein LSH36_137g06085 [Paralvinella palmiformis]|uniref:Uncharacterized protein n=1 Tax=Paralvinella palmiformis TaxID=53620 RepID=A0AAD9NAP1_9ANNE|nr:hypothetical protein LSH36_137g06085 [Paralvinella palmiformis]